MDGYALIYRAFFALISRPLTTARGENTSAAWGVVNFLQRLTSTHRPDYLGWVHDSGLSFRHERYPAYKATREKLTEELQSDFDTGMERIYQLLEAYRVPVLSLKGYEADDVIGTLARQSAEQGTNVVIVSGDKDFQQLVRPGIWLLNPGRGGPASVEEQWVSVENGAERLGIPPAHVTDYLALVGDSSDGYPGLPGWGAKSAAAVLAKFKHLEDIPADWRTWGVNCARPGALSVTLEKDRELALLFRDLATLRTNIPVFDSVDQLEWHGPTPAFQAWKARLDSAPVSP